jgi:ribosomal protein L12E/L44/L45/RPP1/RPP2
MKVIAAYLLAALGGNTTPSAEDIKSILESGYKHKLDNLSFAVYFGNLSSQQLTLFGLKIM